MESTGGADPQGPVRENSIKPQGLGILSSFVVSICCVGTPLLALLGLGGLGLGAFVGRFHWFFILMGSLLLTGGWLSYLQEKRRCQMQKCQMTRQGFTKVILMVVSLVVVLFTAFNLYPLMGNKQKPSSAQSSSDGYITITIPVQGMSCFSCELSVENALKKVRGVGIVQASAKDKKVIVQYDPKQVSLQELIEAVNQTGYKASAPKEP